jgi:DNA-binding NarL/FixJ family response regulator
MRALIVDDHILFREAFITALRTVNDVEVVGEACDVTTAHGLLESTQPDVVTLDAVLENESGIVAASHLNKAYPQAGILILTGHPHLDQLLLALDNGARGYACKTQPLDAIVDAMRKVAAGGEYVPPQFEAPLLDARNGRRMWGPLEGLSQREREVFQLAARGLTNRGIAEALTISIKTVETHRSKIHQKLGTHSTSDLVRVAVRQGLLV